MLTGGSQRGSGRGTTETRVEKEEGEFVSKVGRKERGPFTRRGPHEQVHSPDTLGQPAVSAEQSCAGREVGQSPHEDRVQQSEVQPPWSPRQMEKHVMLTCLHAKPCYVVILEF